MTHRIILNQVENDISKILTNDIDFIDIPMIPIDDFEKIAKSLDLLHNVYQDDSNGWQYDFWRYYYDNKSNKYCLSGSWYYGNYRLSKEK